MLPQLITWCVRTTGIWNTTVQVSTSYETLFTFIVTFGTKPVSERFIAKWTGFLGSRKCPNCSVILKRVVSLATFTTNPLYYLLSECRSGVSGNDSVSQESANPSWRTVIQVKGHVYHKMTPNTPFPYNNIIYNWSTKKGTFGVYLKGQKPNRNSYALSTMPINKQPFYHDFSQQILLQQKWPFSQSVKHSNMGYYSRNTHTHNCVYKYLCKIFYKD